MLSNNTLLNFIRLQNLMDVNVPGANLECAQCKMSMLKGNFRMSPNICKLWSHDQTKSTREIHAFLWRSLQEDDMK